MPKTAMQAALLCVLALSAACVVRAQGAAPSVLASSIYDDRYLPEHAVDGDPATRWASRAGSGAPEWLLIDLSAPTDLADLTITWEHAYAAEYELQTSDDGEAWRALFRQPEGRGGVETVPLTGTRTRYLRLWCTRPGPFPLASVWEISSGSAPLNEALHAAARGAAAAREKAAAEARRRAVEALRASGLREVLFAVRAPGVDGHWYANFGYYARSTEEKLYRPVGGRLCRLDVPTGRVTPVLDDPAGCVRDPELHYDGRKVLFSYLPSGQTHYHLYEIGIDGTGLRRLTDGDCDDIEPTYLPDGGIAFCSSRCSRWVNCWLTPVAVLYRCDAAGGDVRMLSANVEHDNTPHVLPDGRILYTRWEYIDRSQVDYHHLWTANPDGTGQMAFFGNLHPGTVMIDARPIGGTGRVLAIFSPGHGQLEHAGAVTLVDPGDGPDNQALATTVASETVYRDPYPLSDELFLVANGPELQVMGREGAAHTLYRLPDGDIARGLWCHEPSPVATRAREPVIAPRTDEAQDTGRLLLLDAHLGRNMTGVKRGDIRKLLVLESLPKPINYTGGMDPITYGGTFTLERVVGTVPVEPDGSAYMELPALRSFFFVALDEDDNTVKRMQSFLTLQPGETAGCVGCHEQRTRTLPPGVRPAAVRRGPSRVTPLEGLPEVFDFPRDIQPILDRNCVRCHDYTKHADGDGPRSGGMILSADRGPMYSHSYYCLTLHRQFVDGRNDPKSNLPPRSIGAVASPLLRKLSGEHHGVSASEADRRMVRYWIESGAVYPGTYGALGGGAIGGYYANGLVETDLDWPETKAAQDAIQRRCLSCHAGSRVLPVGLSDERDVSFWRPDWNDPRLRYARHAVFNLTRPELSLMLLAPLSVDAGGYGLCRAEGAETVFASTSDPDYAAILGMCRAGKRRLEQIGRFDMPRYRPPEPYLREMNRYGLLPTIPSPDEAVDYYALDRAYWQSSWYRGTADGASSGTGER